MSYEKQTWATGDVITAEKLNHMEDGIAGAESGGGGGESIHTLTATITNDTEYDMTPMMTYPYNSGYMQIIEIPAGETMTLKYLYVELPEEYGGGYVVGIDSRYQIDDSSDAVNCVETSNQMITITDPTQDSSITLTLIEYREN